MIEWNLRAREVVRSCTLYRSLEQ